MIVTISTNLFLKKSRRFLLWIITLKKNFANFLKLKDMVVVPYLPNKQLICLRNKVSELTGSEFLGDPIATVNGCEYYFSYFPAQYNQLGIMGGTAEIVINLNDSDTYGTKFAPGSAPDTNPDQILNKEFIQFKKFISGLPVVQR